MLAPDVHFMVLSSEIVDDEGYAHRGTKVTQLGKGPEPPEYRLRDFAFAAYSGPNTGGLREVRFGKFVLWAFSSPREHCEEVVIFRRGTDTRKKWDEDKLHEPSVGLDMFFMMRQRQITNETPLFKQFNGEWGFWESFFVPILDEQQTMQTLTLMDPSMCEDHFGQQRLPVTCHTCSEGQHILTIPDDLSVEYEVKIAVKEMEMWSDMCNKIGDDMIITEPGIYEYKHLYPGNECIACYHETSGLEIQARLIKRDLEQLKMPIVATFKCEMNVAKDWEQDDISLVNKFDAMNSVYSMNLLGGFSSMSGARADPWQPMARLALNALSKVLARYPDIRTVMDVGCGDMAWIQYFLHDHAMISYVGADIMPYCLALNMRRFPKLQFLQTDLSNLSGIEVLPQGCDLVIAKDIFNHMTLPDAINAVKRVIGTRPRFLLTHVHAAADNTGWERRIDKHLHYTRYDYNKPPFSLPYPATDVQRISDEAYFVLYEITPEGASAPPPQAERMKLPVASDLAPFSLVDEGRWVEPAEKTAAAPTAAAELAAGDAAPAPAPKEGFQPPPRGERTKLATPVTELPDIVEEAKAAPERKPIKGLPAVEFRARCDLIFDKFDLNRDEVLSFEELAALMEAGGRSLQDRSAYESLCKRLQCDASLGLVRKDVYKFFEVSPQALWEEVYRSINPLTHMVKMGADKMPETFLEKPLPSFLFEDGKQFAMVYVEVNAHMYHGAAEYVNAAEHVQVFFGKQRLEVHICAPEAFGSKNLCLWKLIVSPLAGEVVMEDCQIKLQETEGRFGAKKLTVKLMKATEKKWYKIGQVAMGQRK